MLLSTKREDAAEAVALMPRKAITGQPVSTRADATTKIVRRRSRSSGGTSPHIAIIAMTCRPPRVASGRAAETMCDGKRFGC